MKTKRKTWYLQKKDILYVEENHDGKYGAKGQKRLPKRKTTPEDIQRVNRWNKSKKAKIRLMEYFSSGDLWATYTYKPENRPPDMDTAKKQFLAVMDKLRKIYRKRGRELFWIRNIEKGTKGAWHIHFVINDIGDTASLIERAWPYGGVYVTQIRKSNCPEEDFQKLADYITKDERTREKKKDGTMAKPRVSESSYSHSRNMPLPEPVPKELKRWPKKVKPKKGYYIADLYEGKNPVSGYNYRHYTMIRLNRRI